MRDNCQHFSVSRLSLVMTTIAVFVLAGSCQPYGHVSISHIPESGDEPNHTLSAVPEAKLDPITRYGGYVLTAQGMPHGDYAAYLWAKKIGTLVAYETFLRRYPDSSYSRFFRDEICLKFVPEEKEWQESWKLYSKMEIIDGAIYDPAEGFILIGRPGSGRLAPFLYEDLIVALECSLAGDKVGVTMNRIFPARFDQPDDPEAFPYVEHETSVDFYSKKLLNAHLAYVIFEGDRMLKSLGAGYDIFLREEVRSKIAGFRTQSEMAAMEPPAGEGTYGRVWIELLSVRVNTTEHRNVAMFSDVKMEVRADSKHEPPIRFAKHIQDHYDEYSQEFPIFGEVERSARIVSIARWLTANYPDVATKLVDDAYVGVKVYVPQVIKARYQCTHKTATYEAGLTGGVIFPNVNRYSDDPNARLADTRLTEVPEMVLKTKPQPSSLAWQTQLANDPKRLYTVWKITPRPGPSPVAGLEGRSASYAVVP